MDAEKIVFINGNDDEIALARSKGVAEDKLPKYVPGCIKNGISKEIAEEIWAQMADFAKYAFNKSHAAAYAAISMQTAVLKALYPLEFMSGLLTSVMDAPKKYKPYIARARKMGLTIAPFNINECVKEYSIKDDKLLPGLLSIVSLGENVANKIVENRGEGYKGLTDFHERVPECNRRALENLIKAGAFDFTGHTRRSLVEALPGILKKKKDHMEGQMSLFDVFEDMNKDDFQRLPEYSPKDILADEKSATQIYLSGHPLMEYKSYIDKNIKDTAVSIIEGECENGKEVNILVYVNTVKIIYTKKDNRRMAFVSAEDETGDIEIVVFPDTFEKYKGVIKEESSFLIKGNVSISDDEEKENAVLASEITSADELPAKVFVRVKDTNEWDEKESVIKEFMASNPGKDTLVVYIASTKHISCWDYGVNHKFAGLLVEDFGKENIVVNY